MEVLVLRYLLALYPLLILVVYALVCLYDRNFKLLVLVWRPFGAIISCFRKQFNIRQSLIHAFASFFLLSYYSFLYYQHHISSFVIRICMKSIFVAVALYSLVLPRDSYWVLPVSKKVIFFLFQ